MGRHRWTSRLTVQDCLPLDVEKFRQAGPALANASAARGTMFWSRDGAFVGTIRYEIISSPDGASIRIPRQSIAVDGESRLVEECLMRIATTHPCLGGRRFWFVCRCGRRVGKVYLPPEEQIFACRICHNLTYESAQKHDQREYDLARNIVALNAVLEAASGGSPLAERGRKLRLGIGGLVLLGKWAARAGCGNSLGFRV